MLGLQCIRGCQTGVLSSLDWSIGLEPAWRISFSEVRSG